MAIVIPAKAKKDTSGIDQALNMLMQFRLGEISLAGRERMLDKGIAARSDLQQEDITARSELQVEELASRTSLQNQRFIAADTRQDRELTRLETMQVNKQAHESKLQADEFAHRAQINKNVSGNQAAVIAANVDLVDSQSQKNRAQARLSTAMAQPEVLGLKVQAERNKAAKNSFDSFKDLHDITKGDMNAEDELNSLSNLYSMVFSMNDPQSRGPASFFIQGREAAAGAQGTETRRRSMIASNILEEFKSFEGVEDLEDDPFVATGKKNFSTLQALQRGDANLTGNEFDSLMRNFQTSAAASDFDLVGIDKGAKGHFLGFGAEEVSSFNKQELGQSLFDIGGEGVAPLESFDRLSTQEQKGIRKKTGIGAERFSEKLNRTMTVVGFDDNGNAIWK